MSGALHLTDRVKLDLLHLIEAERLQPGDKLPPSDELCRQFDVSRTVVREAISSLRAAGLVATQQGVGAFVQAAAAAQPFRIDENSLDLIKEVINVLELRIGLEAEAAALAAQRRKPEHLEAMRKALDRMAQAIEASEDAIAPDLDFHQTIAEATGNTHFTHLFSYLGALMIPRARVQTFRFFADDRTAYLNRVNGEHEDIYQAISRQDTDAARSAMRLHLSNSRERLRKAMEQSKEQPRDSLPRGA